MNLLQGVKYRFTDLFNTFNANEMHPNEVVKIHFYGSTASVKEYSSDALGIGQWLASTGLDTLAAIGAIEDVQGEKFYYSNFNTTEQQLSDYEYSYFTLDHDVTISDDYLTSFTVIQTPTVPVYLTPFAVGHSLSNTINSPRNVSDGFIEGFNDNMDGQDHCKNVLFEIKINSNTLPLESTILADRGCTIRLDKTATGLKRVVISYDNVIEPGNFTLIDEITTEAIVASQVINIPGFVESQPYSLVISTLNHHYYLTEGVIQQVDDAGPLQVFGCPANYTQYNDLLDNLGEAINDLKELIDDISKEINEEFNSFKQTYVSR